MKDQSGSFPRVLILGEVFKLTSGGGITMSNLFADWPSEKLAVISERTLEANGLICSNYYQLGAKEVTIKMPLRVFQKPQVSKAVLIFSPAMSINAKANISQNSILNVLKPLYRFLRNTTLASSHYFGFFHFLNRTVLSEDLKNWIRLFSPDVIYCQVFSFQTISLVMQVHEFTKRPIVIHIMDDFTKVIIKHGFFYKYWNNTLEKEFKSLVRSSSICLSISDSMANEYVKRYGKIFIPYRNPIDISKWLEFTKQNWEITNQVRFVYTGRLAVPNIEALLVFCRVVDSLNSSGISASIEIYSGEKNNKFINRIKKLKGIIIKNPVPYKDIPQLLPKYDFALLPIDFTNKGINYAKFSISTKTSEYMISGVPTILLAPQQVALTDYANKNSCMYVINTIKVAEIKRKLLEIIFNLSLRESIAKKAVEVAILDSDAVKVRESFKRVLLTAIER